jgi:hypothetical protein
MAQSAAAARVDTPDLVVDVLDVVIGGLRRDKEPVSDLLRCESPRCEAQHIDFATGQPARIFRPTACRHF